MNFHRHQSDKDKEFLEQRIKLLAQAAVRVPIVLLIISVIVSLALKDKVSPQRLLIWAILFQCAAIPRAIFAKGILNHSQRQSDPKRDYWIFVLLAALTGLAAGLSAPLFFPYLSTAEQAFIGMVLTGLVAGGVATSGSSPYVLAAYALTALLPLGIAWTWYGNDRSHLVTWLTLIFSLVMVIYARDGKIILYESFLIRRQRDQAYALLEQKNTEIVLANAAVKKLAQTKTRVLAAASHDLRQPLHALSIYSAVLAANPAPNTLHEIGKNIDQLVGSLGGLLDAMLDLSQLDNQSFPVQNSTICLSRVCKKIAQEFEPTIHSKNLCLETSLLPAPTYCDVTILERIIRNLLDNSVKYTAAGSIRITTLVEHGKSIVSISDSGKGIADDQIERIFEEFYQVDNPGRDRSQGLGLGLSIVQRMNALIAAEMHITSKLGVGTTITLQLPRLESQELPSETQQIVFSQLHGKTMLLIDDEPSIIASMSALLHIWGANSITAYDLTSTLDAITSGVKIDAIVADLRLKEGENGVDVVRHIQERIGFTPALIISGETAYERLSEAQSLGFPLLQKPISPEQLYLALVNLLLSPPTY